MTEAIITLRDVIGTGKRYEKLGWAVQKQLDELIEGTKQLEDCNANALKKIRNFIGTEGVTEFEDEGLRDEIDDYLAAHTFDESGRVIG